MTEQIIQEVQRPLKSLSEFKSNVTRIMGLPNSSPQIALYLQEYFMSNASKMTHAKHISLASLYTPNEILYGQNAETCRYVFSSDIVGSGGNGTIYEAFDRLKGIKGVAKVIPSDVLGSHKDEYNKIFQREAEVMTALQEDSFLRQHIVDVWDIAYVQMEKADTIIILEEYMDIDKQPMLIQAELQRFSVPEKLRIVEQLCVAIDRMSDHDIFHYDLSNKNIYIDYESILIKIADFGNANVVYDIKKRGVEGTPEFASPEQPFYTGEGKEPGLQSEVFATTALAFYILLNKAMPYDPDEWPNSRKDYTSTDYRFITQFSPKGKAALIENINNSSYTEDQIRVLSTVFEKGLAKNPEDRYQTCHELFQALMDAIYPESELIGFWKD